MIGKEIPISKMEEKYFFINNSYINISNKETNIKQIIEKNKNKKLYKLINNSYSITFIGDSITEGTKNNFHPWYEPLIYYFQNKKIINISKGSYTTSLTFYIIYYSIHKTLYNYRARSRQILRREKFPTFDIKTDMIYL